MRKKLKYASIFVLASTIFSALSAYEDFMTVILPSWAENGTDMYVYIVAGIKIISIVLKLIAGILGILSLEKYVFEGTTARRLAIAEKFAVGVVASGLASVFINIYNGRIFSILSVCDITFTVITGLVFIYFSMYVRAECMMKTKDQ